MMLLNTEKTEALWLRRNHDNLPHINIDKINKDMNILDVYFTYECRKSQKPHFDEILKLLSKITWYMQENSSREDICNPLFMFRRSLISLKKKIKQVDSTIFNSVHLER